MAEEKLHGGHRARLKARFLKDGLRGFEPHNVLELLLFYAIPQRDTNPLAHKLINRFGSVSGVLNAPVYELCEVDGISEHTATLIKLIPAIGELRAAEQRSKEIYDSLDKVGRLMLRRYANIKTETVLLLLFDEKRHLLDTVKVAEGNESTTKIDMNRVVRSAISCGAKKAMLVHNHPSGSSVASAEDISATVKVANTLRSVDIEFLEHLLIAGKIYEPILTRTEGVFWKQEDRDKFFAKQ